MKKLIYSQEDLDLILSLELDKLQSNWNSSREFIQEAKNCYFESIGTQILLNKMNELEGKDKE